MTAQSLTVAEFCEANRLSRATFYNLLREGKAPQIMKVGRRTLIPADAVREWQQRMLASTQLRAA
jgi:excisionase family DNA binding protein